MSLSNAKDAFSYNLILPPSLVIAPLYFEALFITLNLFSGISPFLYFTPSIVLEVPPLLVLKFCVPLFDGFDAAAVGDFDILEPNGFLGIAKDSIVVIHSLFCMVLLIPLIKNSKEFG